MVSFNYGQKANLNDGITPSLVLFSPVFILGMTYLIYKEKINLIQSVGLGAILIGVLGISLFKAADPTHSLDDIAIDKT